MNNLTLGNDALLLLRDARRRAGRVRGRGRPERRARGDEQHAEHADRGARARIPAARARATRCGAARAAPGAIAAATGSCASWRRSTDELLADRRAPAPRAARRRRRRARRARAATCSTARAAGQGDRRAARRASGCASKRPVGEDSAMPQRPSGSGSSGSGSWARGWPRTSPRAGFPLTRVDPHARARPSAGRPSTARGACATPAEVAARSDVVISMVVDGDAGGRGAARRGRRARAAREGLLCVDMSTIGAPDDARDRGPRWRERGVQHARRARDRLLAARRGRHAHDHGRRRAEDFARARPLLEAMGELIVHVGELGQGADAEADQQLARRRQRGGPRRGAPAARRRRDRPRRASRCDRPARAPRRSCS